MKLKLRVLLKLKGISQKELSELAGLSEPLLSKFNNYVCLPIPKDLDAMCKILNCDALDIYDKDEIQLIKPKPRRTKEEMDCYRLTVPIDKSFRWIFERYNLNRLGFESVKDVVNKLLVSKLHDMSIKKTISEYNEFKAKKKAELDENTTNSTKVVS